ncbi:MAG: hypothetical protein JW821_05445, partial [Deltaproteobacteria bacterium]|nr:hypothetical protein [Deltaproteobacteria bacterium]
VGKGRTEKEGVTLFHVAEGVYRILLSAANHIEINDIRVAASRETRVRADWGRLTLSLRDPARYVAFYDSEGRKVLGGGLDQGEKRSCCVRPGEYRIEILSEPRRELHSLMVHANRETVAGDGVNHSPRITLISCDPLLVKAGQSAKIRVEARDDDGDPLTYSYSPAEGRIQGKGAAVVYEAPLQKGTYRVRIEVSDPHGASESSDVCLSGGDLTVRAVTGNGEPFGAYVHIYNPLGTRVEAGNVGPGGARTWQLPEGTYRLEVAGDNMVAVPDLRLTSDEERRVHVAFGRLVIESLGPDGEPVPAQVELLDSEGLKVGGGRPEKEGIILFNLREGIYRARLNATNPMEVTGIQVVPGRENRVRAEWGKLTLSLRNPGKYASLFDSEGRKVQGRAPGPDGRLSWYVRPGSYRVEVLTEPLQEFRDLVVHANRETIVGDEVNHPPRITNISSDPPMVKAGESATIRVEATDEDRDRLSYEYIPNVGRIEGSGAEVVYHAPHERGPFHVIIRVSDPHGESHAFDCFISGGDLTLRALTGDEKPLDASVHIHNPLGVRVASGNLGDGGTRTWRLPEGTYKLQVFGDNMIEVPDVNVVTDKDSLAVVNFGKLVVECFGVDRRPLNTYVTVKTDLDEKVAAAPTGEDGLIGFHLRPGVYDVFAYQANAIVRPSVRIDSQQEYVVALNPAGTANPELSSKKPAIEQIVVKPVRAADRREFDISVILSSQKGEEPSFHYFCEGGTVSGSGSRVVVRGAGNGAILVRVTVMSASGDRTSGEVLIPARREWSQKSERRSLPSSVP